MDGGIELSVLNVEREKAGNGGPGVGTGTGTENILSDIDSEPAHDHGTNEAGGRRRAPADRRQCAGMDFILCSFVLETLVWSFCRGGSLSVHLWPLDPHQARTPSFL